jgi:alanyl-tRNA synthetase
MAEDVDGINVLVTEVEVEKADDLMELSDHIKGALGPSAIMLAAAADGRVSLVANFSDQVVERGVRAGDLIKEIAPVVSGKGGGRPNMARGGGSDAGKTGEALEKARQWLAEKLT